MEYDQHVRIGYEIIEGIDIWVTPGLNQRIYDQFINVAGQQRDSNGWYVNVGATVRLTEKTRLEGFVGYTSQTFLAGGVSTPAFTFGLTGVWNGYEPLTIRPAFMRSINESAYSDYQNYVSTTLGVDFTYDIHDAWKMVGGTGFNIAQYNPVPGSGVGAADGLLLARVAGFAVFPAPAGSDRPSVRTYQRLVDRRRHRWSGVHQGSHLYSSRWSAVIR